MQIHHFTIYKTILKLIRLIHIEIKKKNQIRLYNLFGIQGNEVKNVKAKNEL